MAVEAPEIEAATYPRGFSRDTDWKWPMVPARELVTLNYGRALKADTRSPGNVPVFGTNGQCGWHDAPLAKAPGLILGRKGQGPLGVEWSDKDFWVIDTAYYASILTPDVDLKYLFHLVKYVGLNHLKDGTSNPTLSRDAFGAQLFPLPPLAEQKAIAAVRGALDDKIELNRRMNATLEAMARALFQSWFVDFDPVRAKLDGRQPVGLDQATADLFPETFEETALGHVPNGWQVKLLGEVIELAYGKPLKAEDRMHGHVCVYGANGPVGWHDEKLVSGPGIVIGRKGNPGVVTWAHGDFYPIDTTFYVKPIGACRSLYFFYYALSFHNLANLSADSAVPGLNRNHAYMSKQVIPSQPVLTAFDSQIAPIFAAMHANEEQSRSLALTRDTLIPKLLSSELTVPLKPSSK